MWIKFQYRVFVCGGGGGGKEEEEDDDNDEDNGDEEDEKEEEMSLSLLAHQGPSIFHHLCTLKVCNIP